MKKVLGMFLVLLLLVTVVPSVSFSAETVKDKQTAGATSAGAKTGGEMSAGMKVGSIVIGAVVIAGALVLILSGPGDSATPIYH